MAVEIHMVGGAVRDMLMGIEPKDIDYVVVGANHQYMVYDPFGGQDDIANKVLRHINLTEDHASHIFNVKRIGRAKDTVPEFFAELYEKHG